jgi:hypothetical protein
MSGWPNSGLMSLAQGVQIGVAVAQAGWATSKLLEAPAPGGSGFGGAELSSQTGGAPPPRDGIPVALADMLALAPNAAGALRDFGSDMQAWLDIATGRLALRAVQEIRGRKQPASEEPPPEVEPERAPERAPALEPLSPAAGEPHPAPAAAQGEPGLRRAADAAPSDDVQAMAAEPAWAREPAEQRVRTALDVARRSFGAALERLDAQLEPALAVALTRLGGSDPTAAAESAAARMRSQPERAIEAHTRTEMPGVLALLRWDFSPLSEPLPAASAAQG